MESKYLRVYGPDRGEGGEKIYKCLEIFNNPCCPHGLKLVTGVSMARRHLMYIILFSRLLHTLKG